ncbi:sensor domain-containing diguanylate cyclase [Alcaligenes endophyticus]|uniref:GGDEF domain-containing protein n=2 Tax=Alcaligenes endophyticus TaxID=1929088 RepID=A0ABT8EJJ7_9BURK|nr:GGDEF domain-containing protein [Alcaligenes endophyticus]MDN4121464.1 GGDEF domain-containing protein [Alcaligenes endophyticus]
MSEMSGALPIADLFDISPNSMWLEDYSLLQQLFNKWRQHGVEDLGEFLREDTQRIQQCAECIRLIQVNQSTLNLFAAQSFEDLSSRLTEVIRDDAYHFYAHELEQLWQGQTRFENQTINYSLHGQRMDILLKGVILRGHEHDWSRVLVVIEDITEHEQARLQAKQSAQYARSLFQHAPISLWVEDFSAIKLTLEELRGHGITDLRTFTDVHPEFIDRCMTQIRVLDVNNYTLDLFQARTKADLLAGLPNIFRREMRDSFREQLIDLWDGKLFQQREVKNHDLEGNLLHIHMQFSVFTGYENDWSLVLLALTDITARKKAESYLEYLGQHDVLTKLKNRAFYTDELHRLNRLGILPVSFMVVDLNCLKEVNDTLGHISGDALLQRTGEILLQVVEEPYQVARVGGDEFVIIMPKAAEQECEVLQESLNSLVELNNQFYSGPKLDLSTGYATCRELGKLDKALRLADERMYEHKRAYYKLMAEKGQPSA